jgi:hypothetical protein
MKSENALLKPHTACPEGWTQEQALVHFIRNPKLETLHHQP